MSEAMIEDNSIKQRYATEDEVIIDGMGHSCDLYSHTVIEIPGRLDQVILKKAFDNLSRRFPMIRSHYVRGEDKCHWLIQDEPALTVEEHDNVDEAKQRTIEQSFFINPNQYVDTDQLIFHILHFNDHDRLIIRINHMLTDGGGIRQILYHLPACYRQLLDDPDYIEPWGNLDPLKNVKPLVEIGRADIPRINRTFMSYEHSRNMENCFTVPMNDGPSTNGGIAHYRIAPEQIKNLKARWKPERITLNDILVTAYTRALVNSFEDPNGDCTRVALTSALDLRRFFSNTDNIICNLSSVRNLETAALPLTDPISHLHFVAEQTKIWKTKDSPYDNYVACKKLFHNVSHGFLLKEAKKNITTIHQLKGRCTTGFSNMGAIDENLVDFGHGPCLNVRISPPPGFPPYLLACATGCAGAINLAIGYWESNFSYENFTRLFENFSKEINFLENA